MGQRAVMNALSLIPLRPERPRILSHIISFSPLLPGHENVTGVAK